MDSINIPLQDSPLLLITDVTEKLNLKIEIYWSQEDTIVEWTSGRGREVCIVKKSSRTATAGGSSRNDKQLNKSGSYDDGITGQEESKKNHCYCENSRRFSITVHHVVCRVEVD